MTFNSVTARLMMMTSAPVPTEIYGNFRINESANTSRTDDEASRAMKRNYNIALARGNKKEAKRLEKQLISIGVYI